MSGKESDETLESEIQFLEEKKVVWWDAIAAFSNEKTDGKILRQAFTPEQYRIIKALLTKLGEALDWHMDKQEDPHSETLGDKISRLDAKLRNHRHETGKTFSAKPEF